MNAGGACRFGRGQRGFSCHMKTIRKDNQCDAGQGSRAERADELKEAFKAVSPFIEKHTSVVCPECNKVCCIDKHGRYDKDDLVFIRSLGADTHHDLPERGESEPCRYLNETGCSRQRWERPFRCTQFFCDPLLKSLENDNAKLYRAFVEYLQLLISVRQSLLEESRMS